MVGGSLRGTWKSTGKAKREERGSSKKLGLNLLTKSMFVVNGHCQALSQEASYQWLNMQQSRMKQIKYDRVLLCGLLDILIQFSNIKLN